MLVVGEPQKEPALSGQPESALRRRRRVRVFATAAGVGIVAGVALLVLAATPENRLSGGGTAPDWTTQATALAGLITSIGGLMSGVAALVTARRGAALQPRRRHGVHQRRR
jgi:drug/metabolite transporter (DMT)-like permease